MRTELDDAEEIEVQLAPLIDCVFLLLIFFLVATTLKEIRKELPIELPEASAAVAVATPVEPLVIAVDADGNLYLGSEPVGLEVLHSHVRTVAQQNPNRRVRIDGDRVTPFQHIVHVMDLCQFEGLTNIGVHIADEKKFRKK